MTAPITVVSWNILQGLHYSTTRSKPVQNPEIENHLAALDADVLVLPEAWRFGKPLATWAEDLAESMGYELHQWVSDTPSRRRENVPWRIVVLTRTPTRRLDDVVLPQLGRFGRRAVVRLELTDSGLTLGATHLYGVHYLRENPVAWFRERQAFRDAIQGLDIVAGDMNIWSPISLRDARGMRMAVKGRTFPSHRPHSQIDQILVNDRVEVLQGERLPNLGSDHLALKATLQARIA